MAVVFCVLCYLEDLIAEGYSPEQEILSILNVPPGKMGRVIGKRGASIQAVKECCGYVFCLYLELNIHFHQILLNRNNNNEFFFSSFSYSAEIIIGGAKGPPDKVKTLLLITFHLILWTPQIDGYKSCCDETVNNSNKNLVGPLCPKCCSTVSILKWSSCAKILIFVECCSWYYVVVSIFSMLLHIQKHV